MQTSQSEGFSLYQLLAREWNLEDEIVQCNFNSDDTAVLFRLSSGNVALVATRDAESTKSRTRVEVDSGRTTIRPRKKPIPKARFAPIDAISSLPVVRFGANGFMATDGAGIPYQITAGGQSIEKLNNSDSKVTALCSSHSGDMVAIARQSNLTIYLCNNMSVLQQIELDRSVECMAFFNDAKSLAIWGVACLEVIAIQKDEQPRCKVLGLDNITQITWDTSGDHLACATSANSFYIVDIKAETYHEVRGYPRPVSSAFFSEKARALVTSGAYRLAGWSTDDLPKLDRAGTPLTTGKSGLIAISTIAVHPEKSLVSVGYANGLVTISNIGTTQEMMVHQEAGTEVNSLSWSNSGEHLAIGFKSGKAAVVTFPKQLFK